MVIFLISSTWIIWVPEGQAGTDGGDAISKKKKKNSYKHSLAEQSLGATYWNSIMSVKSG